MDLSAASFAALARSSPWRWRTVRFTATWTGERGPYAEVRAWVRRPDALRVERLDGRVLHAGREAGPSTVVLTSSGRGGEVEVPQPGMPAAARPELDGQGLVLRRPAPDDLRYDAPMYQTYHWVAMLDPVELADGQGRWTGDPAPWPVALDQLRVVDHHGSPAWEARVTPTEAYDPRCSCCPLLPCAISDAYEQPPRPGEEPREYAEAHVVRLDVRTGICVFTEQVGGPRHGTGHDLAIEAVDETLPDELFATKPSRWRR